jgi:hypothetical protein
VPHTLLGVLVPIRSVSCRSIEHAVDLLFLGPGREGSTPRHESDVASRLFSSSQSLLMHHRAFGPMNDGRRSRPGQHRLPPRSSGHDPCSRRGKHRDYQSGLQGGDKMTRKKRQKSCKGLKRLRQKFENFFLAEKLSPFLETVANALRRHGPGSRRLAPWPG